MMADMNVEERTLKERTLKARDDCIEQFARLPIYLAERLADSITDAITVAVEAERVAFHKRLLTGLAEVYINYPLAIACLCDDHIDKSGALLGEVRGYAIEARASKKK